MTPLLPGDCDGDDWTRVAMLRARCLACFDVSTIKKSGRRDADKWDIGVGIREKHSF